MKYLGLLDDFISYVKINTRSVPESNETPSFNGICDLAYLLKEQLQNLVDEIYFDERHCYLYGLLKKNVENKAAIGFNAHMDTAPVESGENVKPKIFTFDGNEVEIGNGILLKREDIPDYKSKIGKTFITASGDTLLGADDKAGIANIMNMIRYIKTHPEIEHGDIYIAFTPDEEIGRGTKYFDLNYFKVDYGFTVDGGGVGEFDVENFNAINGKIIFNGYNVHPGSAYKKMVNAVRSASHFISYLNDQYTPEFSRDYNGFIHFDSIKGDVNRVEVEVIIRDFKKEGIRNFQKMLNEFSKNSRKKFSRISIDFQFHNAYYNMKEIIDKYPEIIRIVEKSAKNIGLSLKKTKIRGGTDGAMLSHKSSIPIPNIFTGGYNFHSKKEFAVLEEMEKSVDLLIEIVKNG